MLENSFQGRFATKTGLLLVDKRNIPKSVISEILKIIRIDDVYIQNEDMFCCLFISNESFDKFSLDILPERANAEKFEKEWRFYI